MERLQQEQTKVKLQHLEAQLAQLELTTAEQELAMSQQQSKVAQPPWHKPSALPPQNTAWMDSMLGINLPPPPHAWKAQQVQQIPSQAKPMQPPPPPPVPPAASSYTGAAIPTVPPPLPPPPFPPQHVPLVAPHVRRPRICNLCGRCAQSWQSIHVHFRCYTSS